MSDDAARQAFQVDRAAEMLASGGLVAFPTETVYGLGADASSPAAVARIFAAKGRPIDHPLIVHLADARQLGQWARDVPAVAWRLAQAFWPGPLTLILPRGHEVPAAVTGGLDTVAVRVPDHPLALALLARFGGGIAAPSANRYGRVSATTAEHVREELGEQVDLVLDGGPCDVGIESTIVDASDPRRLVILRPGVIGATELRRVVGTALASGDPGPVRCPGRKASHYAPRARVILVSEGDDAVAGIARWRAEGLRVGWLASQPPPGSPESAIWLPLAGNPSQQARVLYRRLRQADQLDVQVLLVVPPPEEGIGHAIADRLRRAAGMGDDAGFGPLDEPGPGGHR